MPDKKKKMKGKQKADPSKQKMTKQGMKSLSAAKRTTSERMKKSKAVKKAADNPKGSAGKAMDEIKKRKNRAKNT